MSISYKRGQVGVADVFISYKREERAEIEQIAKALRSLAVDVWFDARLEAGESFSKEITREAKIAGAVLVCWSPGAVASQWVEAEAMIGLEGKKLVACVVGGQTGLVPHAPFNTIHTPDMIGWSRQAASDERGSALHPGWQSILARIGALLGRSGLADYAVLPRPEDPDRLERLSEWVEANADDKLAAAAWEEVTLLTHAAATAKLKALRQDAEKRKKHETEIAQEPLRVSTKAASRVDPIRTQSTRLASVQKAAASKQSRKPASKSGAKFARPAIAAITVGAVILTGLGVAAFWFWFGPWSKMTAVAEIPAEEPLDRVVVVPGAPVGKATEAFAAAEHFVAEWLERDPGQADPQDATPEELKMRIFRDCSAAYCPEMISIPRGGFRLGSPEGEGRRDEHSQLGKPLDVETPAFALSVHEITWREYNACARARKCEPAKKDESPNGSYPVTNVRWDDAKAFAQWLSGVTGENYRLPSEAEWEYAAEGGRGEQPYSFDPRSESECLHMNSLDVAGWNARLSAGTVSEDKRNSLKPRACDDGYAKTAPVGSYEPNPFGLYDMSGNVWEWVEDCYDKGKPYADGYPVNGQPYVSTPCPTRGYRGGSWLTGGDLLRSAARGGEQPGERRDFLGFRLARDAAPRPLDPSASESIVSPAVQYVPSDPTSRTSRSPPGDTPAHSSDSPLSNPG